jgi:hypothetical protein
VSQFSRGEYAHANNKEDDLAIIASHGLAPRTDDHGSTLPEADQLGAKALYDASGVIGTRTDTDVFAIDLPCTTTLSASATGIGAQTALDLSLEVLDANGAPVTVSSPVSGRAGSPPVSNGMDAQVSVPNATGRYYLRVDGVGNGNPAGSGWSDYGSLGQYRLTGTGCDELPPEPTPEPTTDPQPTTQPTTEPTPTVTPTPTPTATPTPTPTPTPAPAPRPVVKAPSIPRIGLASSGARGGRSTAVARWAPPLSLNGASITRYRVVALRLDSRHRVVRSYGSTYIRPTTRAMTWTLPRGYYVFKVMAWNKAGASHWSAASRIVVAR